MTEIGKDPAIERAVRSWSRGDEKLVVSRRPKRPVRDEIEFFRYVEAVSEFMNKFGLDEPMTEKRHRERDALLMEEVNELQSSKNRVDEIDAMCDIVYVAAGTIVSVMREDSIKYSREMHDLFRTPPMWRADEFIEVTDFVDSNIKMLAKLGDYDVSMFVSGDKRFNSSFENHRVMTMTSLMAAVILRSDSRGFDFDSHFDVVQIANMKKTRGEKSTRPGTNGYDVIKPPGWTGPEAQHKRLIESGYFSS